MNRLADAVLRCGEDPAAAAGMLEEARGLVSRASVRAGGGRGVVELALDGARTLAVAVSQEMAMTAVARVEAAAPAPAAPARGRRGAPPPRRELRAPAGTSGRTMVAAAWRGTDGSAGMDVALEERATLL